MQHILARKCCAILLLLLPAAPLCALKPSGAEVPHIQFSGMAFDIRDWALIGPFIPRGADDPHATDFLRPLGFTETNATEDTWNAVAQCPSALPANSLTGLAYAIVKRGQDDVDLRALYHSSPSGPTIAAYAACVIVCNESREAYLVLAGGRDDDLSAWLNGNILYASKDQRPFQKYNGGVRLPLREGTNFLLVKSDSHLGEWSLSARVVPSREAAEELVAGGLTGFLKKLILLGNEPLDLDLPEILMPSIINTTVEKLDGEFVAKMPEDRAVLSLPNGLYRAVLQVGGYTLRENFCVGDIDEIFGGCKQRAAGYSSDDRIRMNLEGLIKRGDFTLTAEHRKVPDRRWQSRVLFVAAELETAVLRLEHGIEPFRHVPGLHLRGFRSSIDKQPQYYVLFVPSQYRIDGEGLPIAVIMASVFSTPRPFLESVQMNQQVEFDTLSQIGERLGLGLVWSGYRCSPYGYPCDLTHLDEVLGTVTSDYHVDPGRIYLMGFCSSGIDTALAANCHPGRYAALTFLNPVLHRRKNRYQDEGNYASLPAYQAWLRETDPVEFLAKMRDIPMWIIHDGVDPDHGPLRDSVDLVEQAQANGWSPRFDRIRDPSSVRVTVWERQLAWLSLQRRRTTKTDRKASPDSCVGPICSAFGGSFVVVEPSQGDKLTREANARIFDSFRHAWQRSQFGDCQTVCDKDLSAEQERTSNLILVGNVDTNLVWRRLASALPLKISRDSIELGGHIWQGDHLSFQAVGVHPEHPDRKIVFIGSANPAMAGFGTQELAIDGWFDYAIWSCATPKTELVTAGRYQ